jgi:hypothetical protein
VPDRLPAPRPCGRTLTGLGCTLLVFLFCRHAPQRSALAARGQPAWKLLDRIG